MERKVDETAPNASTLWLAIGLGGFSVIASFFLAIYCSPSVASNEAVANEAKSFETIHKASERQ